MHRKIEENFIFDELRIETEVNVKEKVFYWIDSFGTMNGVSSATMSLYTVFVNG
jgi:hypothetical protein